LQKYALLEKTTEWHYPGSNYTGPGTHVITRILNHVFPTDYNDALTLIHDIEYLMYSKRPEIIARSDQTAINQATNNLHGMVIKIGLSIRKGLDLPFYKTIIPEKVGYLLKDFVLQDLEWKSVLEQYGVSFGRYEISV